MVEGRRREAKRSIVVQVHSEQSCSDLHGYCSQFGAIKSLFHYTLTDSLHFVLVEFVDETDVRNILKECVHIHGNQVVPVHSPFLWFRAADKIRSKEMVRKINDDLTTVIKVNNNSEPLKESLYNWLLEAESLSDQILILHRSTKLEELGTRLRFLTARQIELALSGSFPFVQALPFGSTVNGFGRLNCDLDLVLLLDREEKKEDSSSRLVFHAKTSLANERTQAQRHMETIGDICQLFLPGCSNIRRILHARVPIIKYRQDLTGVDCDLSMTNMSGVYMSELLYVFGEVDPRVRPLVFAIRYWAREVGLTNPMPGRWITNFSLTLLVLFFLQQTKPSPVLPTLSTLIALAGAEDMRMTSDGVNCTFVRDISKLKSHLSLQNSNKDSLGNLLLSFFEFYSKFDFSTRAVSLANGVSIPKPDHSALYIVNPLEHGLNVSKNVSPEEMERLRIEMRNASWVLDVAQRCPEKLKKKQKSEPWGLVAIFQASQFSSKGRNPIYFPAKNLVGNRLMDISDLFDDGEDIPLHPIEKRSSVNKVNSDKSSEKLADQKPTTSRTRPMKTNRRRR
ncbi:poly(A) RNA polymerase, mitochondrial isoform X2 [Anabrus simplex]